MITMLLTHCNVNVRYFGATKNLPGVRELFEPVSHINRVCRQSIVIFLPGCSVYPEKVFYNLMEFPAIFISLPTFLSSKSTMPLANPRSRRKRKNARVTKYTVVSRQTTMGTETMTMASWPLLKQKQRKLVCLLVETPITTFGMRATNIHSGKQTSFNQICDRLLFAAITKALEEYNIRKRQRKERQSELKGKNVVGVVDQDSESDEAPSLADTTSTAANNASLRVRISSLLSFSSSSPLLTSSLLNSPHFVFRPRSFPPLDEVFACTRQHSNFALQAHVIVPDQEEISRLIMKRRKENLMAKYASIGLQDSQSEVKKLLNIKQK